MLIGTDELEVILSSGEDTVKHYYIGRSQVLSSRMEGFGMRQKRLDGLWLGGRSISDWQTAEVWKQVMPLAVK